MASIRDFAAKKLGRVNATRGSSDRAGRFPEASLAPVSNRARVSKQVHYNRLTTIANYVEFLAQVVTAHRGDRDLAAAVDRMAKTLRQHRPRGMGSGDNDDPHRMSPPFALVDAFIQVRWEGHPENPFRSGSIQRRNELIFRLDIETAAAARPGDTLGYARVSTPDQNLAAQRNRLLEAGALRIFTDIASGKRADRAGLAELIDHARPAGTLAARAARNR